MAAVESLARGLEYEDEMVRLSGERCEAELFNDGHAAGETGGMADLSKQAEDDKMRIMAARDVYVNSPPPAPKPTPQSATPQPDARIFAGAGLRSGPGLVPTTDSAPTTPGAPPAAPTATSADTPLWKKAATLAAIVAGTGSLPLAGVGLHSMFSSPATPVVAPPAVTRPAESAEPVSPSFSVKVNKRATETP